MADLTFFDTKECEWSDVTVAYGGAVIGKLRGIAYGASKNKQHLHAAGDEPISIQSGNRTYKGTLTVLKSAVDSMNDAALAAAGTDLLDLVVDITVTYKKRGQRGLRTRQLVGCEITDFEEAMKQGDTMMEIALPFLFLRLV
jgi:hypothetical protein